MFSFLTGLQRNGRVGALVLSHAMKELELDTELVSTVTQLCKHKPARINHVRVCRRDRVSKHGLRWSAKQFTLTINK